MAKKIISALAKNADIVNNAVQYVCVGVLFVMMFLGTADVIGRYIFNNPILGTVEIFEILLPAIALLGLGFTQGLKAHVRMEFLVSYLSTRVQDILSLFTTVCMLFFSVLIVWYGTVLGISYREMGSRIATVGVPLYIPQMLVPLGALMLCLVLIIQLLQYTTKLWEKE